MIGHLAALFVIGTAVMIVHDDPLHKFHHAQASVQVASVQPTDAQIAFAARYMRMLPVKGGR